MKEKTKQMCKSLISIKGK